MSSVGMAFDPIKNFFEKRGTIDGVFQAIGMCITAYFLFQILSFIRRNINRAKPLDLSRYGKGSWAVVTGASSGIGRELCLELAKQGFNLVCISKTESKLRKLEDEILSKYPSLRVQLIVSDFNNSHKEGFFDSIYETLEPLDISILINDAAVGHEWAPFHESPEDLFRSEIIVNIFPCTILTKKLIHKLKARQITTAIINVGSAGSTVQMPYASCYASTKAYIRQFTRTLKVEYPHLDILLVEPFYVKTGMVKYRDYIDTITPAQAARGILADLGKYEITNTHWKDDIIVGMFKLTPKPIRDFITKNIIVPQEKKRRENLEKDKSA